MDDASIEMWALLGAIAAAFVLAMLGVLSRWIAQDAAVRQLRQEVMNLRTEYARRTAEIEVVEAEEDRLEEILEVEPEADVRKAA